MPRRPRYWWHRRREVHAERCPACGWYPPHPVLGTPIGRHDPKFIGHAFCCPTRLYASLRSAEGIADQWMAISLWVTLPGVQDTPGADEMWRRMSWALMQRADQLKVDFPIADDAAELGTGVN